MLRECGWLMRARAHFSIMHDDRMATKLCTTTADNATQPSVHRLQIALSLKH